MSPYGRWAGIKIVEPIDQNREKELIGGLRNALERRETLAKAKQSFINAGYKPTEVEAAAQQMPTSVSSQPIAEPTTTTPQTQTDQTPTTSTTPPTQKKTTSKTLMMVLIIISILVLVGAAIFGFFWDKWF